MICVCVSVYQADTCIVCSLVGWLVGRFVGMLATRHFSILLITFCTFFVWLTFKFHYHLHMNRMQFNQFFMNSIYYSLSFSVSLSLYHSLTFFPSHTLSFSLFCYLLLSNFTLTFERIISIIISKKEEKKVFIVTNHFARGNHVGECVFFGLASSWIFNNFQQCWVFSLF